VSEISVQQLGPGDTGRWLVTTRSGSQQLWDLDRHTWQRLPGPGTVVLDYDDFEVSLSSVGVWPQVGVGVVVYFDDPTSALLEQWRASSPVVTIVRSKE
jgi:hypothetical protein